MALFILRQSVEAEDRENVDVLIINHKAYIAQTTSRLKWIFRHLSPEDQVNEYLYDFFQGFEVDVFCPETWDHDRIQAFLLQDLLQVLLVLTEQGEAFAAELLEDLVLLLHEEEKLT